MKMAVRLPEAIFGAASVQTWRFRGDREMVSGSTSPNIRTSWPVATSRMK